MLTISEIGQSGLSRPLRQKDVDRFQVEMVRTLDSYQKMVALRALTFMAEQDCPFDEEYDG
ncbi:MAG: hypothetical protein AAF642_18665, partial [Pseudomonadota bacterium]